MFSERKKLGLDLDDTFSRLFVFIERILRY